MVIEEGKRRCSSDAKTRFEGITTIPSSRQTHSSSSHVSTTPVAYSTPPKLLPQTPLTPCTPPFVLFDGNCELVANYHWLEHHKQDPSEQIISGPGVSGKNRQWGNSLYDTRIRFSGGWSCIIVFVTVVELCPRIVDFETH